ncbi:MAG: rubredoxin [Promethearchaeota archaeon]
MKFECLVCGWIYDEEEEGTPFEELPDDYECPVCGAPKDQFEKIEG